MHRRSLFIFRQDLRLQDNTGLLKAIRNSEEVFLIFIHDTRSIESFGEDDPRFGFIREAINSMNESLWKHGWKIFIYHGYPEKVVEYIIQRYSMDAVYVNHSYSPEWILRDTTIESFCQKSQVSFHTSEDFLMVAPHICEARKVFTPFSLLWKRYIFAHPEDTLIQEFECTNTRFFTPPDDDKEVTSIKTKYHWYWSIPFWYERLDRDFSSYESLRNTPGIDGSTRLSPYIRFGIFSIREIYARFQNNPTLLSEIIWRDFWYQIAYNFPSIYDLEFQEKRRAILWENDPIIMKKIERAETGYPLIDAALRQLYETNWMHNRLRMVVASFITKNCLIDWRWWEGLFKKYLIDYDKAVNYGNWQWSASVGADPKPLRIFNPLLQSEKFDTDARFIKKYIPELALIDPKRIHSMDLKWIYHHPVVDQRESALRAKMRYIWTIDSDTHL